MKTTREILSFMAANLMANKEPSECFAPHREAPSIISLETLTKLKSGAMSMDKLAGYTGPMLLTVPAALFLVQETAADR